LGHVRYARRAPMFDTPSFLRQMADLVDKASRDQTTSEIPPDITNVESPIVSSSDETQIMVPPLQQQIELLKKLSGVESVFDDTTKKDEIASQEIGNNSPQHELATIRKNAGLALCLTSSPFPGE
jgi:hypothetical protein